jgi:hyaluronoglucosaminidase
MNVTNTTSDATARRRWAGAGVMMFMILLIAAPTATSAFAAHAEPGFALRGIKGLWWEGLPKYRLALPWVAHHHMNFLMFCYSSFPASGKDWRADHTAQEQNGFRELAQQADKLGVELCLSFNPGIWSKPPLTYASEDDYQLACKKVKAVHALGIRSFALCLDDINTKLQPADAEKFKTLEAAQVYFVNRLWNDMKNLSPPPRRLIFCPSAYTSAEARKHLDYIKAIAQLNKGIDVFWTGPVVCSPTITAKDADEFAAWVGRKPIVWDNYPVNDMFPWRPLMAPVKGRSADLASHVGGLMSNPMKQWEASKVPLATVAMYLNDPVHYEPSGALHNAIAGEYPSAELRDAVWAVVGAYGTTFLGEKGYPPKPLNEAALRAVRAKLNEVKGLEGLRADVVPTLDADIAEASAHKL